MFADFTNSLAGSQFDYQPNQELAKCCDQLQMFINLPPQKWVHYSDKHGQFIHTAKDYSYIPGFQTVATYFKGHTPEKFIIDFIALTEKVSRAFQEVHLEMQQADNSDIKLRKYIELNDAYKIFRMACSGTQENGGMYGLLKTHEADTIIQQLKGAIEQMSYCVEEAVVNSEPLIPQDMLNSFLTQSFIHMEESDFTSSVCTPQIPQGRLGGIASGFNTTADMINYYMGVTVDLPAPIGQESFELQRMRGVLENPSAMLQGSIINNYIEKINEKLQAQGMLPVIDVNNFYFKDGSSINQHTVAQAMEIIRLACGEREPGQTICIPIVFSGYGWIERRHIASILIKDNAVEYFDPKGESPKSKPMGDSGETLHHLLKECRNTFAPGKKNIHKNRHKLQHDAHNCGVFCCDFLNRRLCLGQEMGWQPSEIEAELLNDMRKVIFNDVRDVIIKREVQLELSTSVSILAGSDLF